MSKAKLAARRKAAGLKNCQVGTVCGRSCIPKGRTCSDKIKQATAERLKGLSKAIVEAKVVKRGADKVPEATTQKLNKAVETIKAKSPVVDIESASAKAGVNGDGVKKIHEELKTFSPQELKDYAKLIGVKIAKKTPDELSLDIAITTQKAKEANAAKKARAEEALRKKTAADNKTSDTSKVKPTIPKEAVVPLLETVGQREFSNIRNLRNSGKEIDAEAESAPIRLISAASELSKGQPKVDTITENITYARSGKLSGGQTQQKAHEEAARALINVSDKQTKNEVADYYKYTAPDQLPNVAGELMGELGRTYKKDRWS